MKKIITVEAELKESHTVKSKTETVSMVVFQGNVKSDFFNGKILSGGVDTQRTKQGKTVLSARYIARGADSNGTPTMLFIENNGTSGENTEPEIVTDNPALEWLESAVLYGTVNPSPNGVHIEIFQQ
ncbi:MAG: DUF3237 domain-containing protein [Eubacterium sp.]|nr:DUF3237 domain-containing protein [Eubacterium sp.]